MQIDDFQEWTRSTAIYPQGDALNYLGLSLGEEAGEACGVISKAIRDNEGVLSPERLEKLLLELGDVLWVTSRLADEAGVPMSTILDMNKKKLESRQARNKIQGSGDFR